MTLLALALVLGSLDPGAVAVVVDSKRPGAAQEADELASLVYLALIDAGLPRDAVLVEEQAERRTLTGAFTRARQCEGRMLCVRSLAGLLGPNGLVVGVDVGRVASELAIHVIAVGSAGAPVAELDVSVESATWRTATGPSIRQLAQTIAGRQSSVAVVQPVEAVVPAAAPEPAPAAPPEVTRTRALPQPLKWSIAAGAAASFAVGAVLAGIGMGNKSTYDRALRQVDGMQGTMLTAAQASRLGNDVNVQLSVALGAVLLGAVLTGVAAWLFLRG